MPNISSRDNTYIKTVRRLLTDRSARRAERAFVCDGPKLCGEALTSRFEPLFMLVTDEKQDDYQSLIDAARAKGCPVMSVATELFKKVSGVENSQGVLLVCEILGVKLPEVLEENRFIILDHVADPGNVGAILRTADAFGINGVFLTGGCADIYNPKTVRATMGSVFRTNLWETSGESAIMLCKAAGLPVYATAIDQSAVEITKINMQRAAVIIGNESAGVSEELLELSDRRVILPMSGGAQSLNASIAAAIVMWEMASAGGRGE